MKAGMTKTYSRIVNQMENSPRGELVHLDIELTERCNNNCVHCYINLPANDIQAKAQEMSFEEVAEILQQAAELECLDVRFTGGEPLLRLDFARIYEVARKLGMRVTLFTNARLITPKLAQLFSQIPPKGTIEVTVYGMHAASCDSNAQQPGAFESFWRGMQLLVDYKIPFIVKSALLPANRDEEAEFEAWARSIPGNEKIPPYSIFFDMRARRDDPGKNQVIRSLRMPPEKGVSFLTRQVTEFGQIKDQYWRSMTSLPEEKLFQCSAGEKQLSIDAYGRVQACLMLRSPELSLPKGTPLRQALEHFKQLKMITASNSDYLEHCAKCFLSNICENCPAKSWSETGSLDQPVQYFCDVAHAKARYLGWLGENEVAWEVEDWKDRIKPT